MNIIGCSDLANEIKKKASIIVEENNLKPVVAIIKVNADKASATYVKRKMESMESCGIDSTLIELEESFTTEQVKNVVRQVSNLEYITGVIVQMPVPKHINVFEVLEAIPPEKDVDCLTSKNLGLLAKGQANILPATPRGIVEFLKRNTDLEGADVLMIGRSEIVGLPLSLMLQQENATVTLAHSRSKYNVNSYDIVISAIGKGESVVVENPKSICIDVGINFKTVDGKLKQIGDFDIEHPYFECKMVTAPKGGIGILTSAMVCLNATELALKIKENK